MIDGWARPEIVPGDLVLFHSLPRAIDDPQLCVVLRRMPEEYQSKPDVVWFEVLFNDGTRGLRANIHLEKVEP